MEASKYLPIGTTVASKYEIMDILGEDDFEILYLVRDFQRKRSFFVLKELFLETFSLRDDTLVITLPEAKGVFAKRKEQIIEEISSKKVNQNQNDIKIYGYEEANNTVYTIMEFSNNANLDRYLQFTPNKGVNTLPTLSELIEEEKKQKMSLAPLKIVAPLFLLLAGGFYGYQYLQTSDTAPDTVIAKTIVNPTNNKTKLEETTTKEPQESPKVEAITPTPMAVERPKNPTAMAEFPAFEEGREELASEVDNQSDRIVRVTSVPRKTLEAKMANETNITSLQPSVALPIPVPVERVQEVVKSVEAPHAVTVKKEEVKPIQTAEMKIEDFLHEYIEVSSQSNIGKTLSYYDTRVKRYFKFRNVSHRKIHKLIQKYNRKWRSRVFKIKDFKVLRSYQKRGVNYFDVKTTTIWSVESRKGKKLSGKSRGVMTLKEVDGSFKIVSISTLK